MKRILPLAAFLSLFTACTRRYADETKKLPVATIQFMSPAPGAVYAINDTVVIAATAISTEPIHGYDVIIKRQDNGVIVYFNHIHDHNDTLLVRDKWKANLSGLDLEAEVLLYLDHDGNTGSRKTPFRIQ